MILKKEKIIKRISLNYIIFQAISIKLQQKNSYKQKHYINV